MAGPLRIALAQMGAELGDVAGNLRRMLELVAEARSRGAMLVCFPELCLSGYLLEAGDYDEALLRESARAERRLAAASASAGAALVYGAPLLLEGALRNAVVLQRPGGERRVYAKTHLEAAERRVFTPGAALLDGAGEGIGLLCCYDLAFPEPCRIVALAGARVLVVPMAWETARGFVMEHVLAARAVENVAYVACANQAGQRGPFRFRGESRVVDPLGRTVCSLGESQGLALADLDLDWVRRLRSAPEGATYPLLADRRPELYGGIAGPA